MKMLHCGLVTLLVRTWCHNDPSTHCPAARVVASIGRLLQLRRAHLLLSSGVRGEEVEPLVPGRRSASRMHARYGVPGERDGNGRDEVRVLR
jgi:hypothetical protein